MLRNKLITLHCLHGFLGSSQDWVGVVPELFTSFKYDFFSPHGDAPSDLEGLACWVNGQAERSSSPRVLMGYSLGGRVAMHALFAKPDLWQAAIFVSTHSGLSCLEERKFRLQADREWARRFQLEPWEDVVGSWNAQPVFHGGKVIPDRQALEYSSSALAASLDQSSLGRQKDFRQDLSQISKPILWVVGDRDQKFKILAENRVRSNSHFQFVSLRDAGHRVPWDQPFEFKKVVQKFLLEQER